MSASQTLDQAIALLDRLMGARPAGAAAAPQQPARAAAAPAANPGKPAKQEAAPAKPASTPAAAKPAKAPAVAAAAREPTAYGVFGKARIQVAKILNVEDIPNSEKLFKMQVDVGGETRQVVGGIKLFYSKEELQGRLVVSVLNLKPAKLAGEKSEAMLLAADTEAGGSLIVKMLQPPAGAQPGDVVTLVPAGTSLAGDAAADAAVPPVKQLKSDDWKTIVAGLAVKGGAACFLGHALHTQGGQVTLPKEMADGAGIH